MGDLHRIRPEGGAIPDYVTAAQVAAVVGHDFRTVGGTLGMMYGVMNTRKGYRVADMLEAFERKTRQQTGIGSDLLPAPKEAPMAMSEASP